MNPPLIGCTKADLDTPALYVDLDAFEFNVRTMSEACRARGVDWRPHSKCHKSSAIARELVEAGAIGVTCAKLGEAEVMAGGGVTDLLIANLIVGPHKVARLVELRKIADPIVCIDHIDQARPISDAMQAAGLRQRVILEVDIGLGRVGVAPGEATLTLAKQVVQLPGLHFAGIMGYEGHLLTLPDANEKRSQIHAALNILRDMKQLLEQNDIACPIVSCGGSGSFYQSLDHDGITELQAGGAMFMDEFYRHQCQLAELRDALFLIVTVVSRPTPERAIIDAGRKTMNMEVAMPKVLGRDDIHIERLSAEHGQLRLEPSAQDLRIGDRLEIVPGYGDLTTVLHDRFYGFRGDRLEKIWPLEARGRLQ
ncbi:MAG: DSD1 family PLP-dependent enzyme [Planctomycetales bacterium]|nr:DSD1 family PLP-dependent enzyme [Planctomycetales bacterium]MCA9205224.1 DSD1 family PLP-dependent enzyme [Planctomycetales bacterium]MCA9224472.1 DSD1 family PLP-dependent enzyme [Planctomycetales bacterium]